MHPNFHFIPAAMLQICVKPSILGVLGFGSFLNNDFLQGVHNILIDITNVSPMKHQRVQSQHYKELLGLQRQATLCPRALKPKMYLANQKDPDCCEHCDDTRSIKEKNVALVYCRPYCHHKFNNDFARAISTIIAHDMHK